MKLKKLLEDINISVKKGDTILTGRFKNHPTKVNKIGKGDDGMPTINGRPVVKFRLSKKKLDEGGFDLGINSYPLAPHQKQELVQAYNSDAGVWGYSNKYDCIVIFKRTGMLMGPKSGQVFVEPSTSAKPQTVSTDVPGGKKLPPDWEKYVTGRY